jgi:hypothetical protein
VVAVAGHAGRRVRPHAEAQRIAAEYRLGRHLKVWRRRLPTVMLWSLIFGFLIGLPGITAVLALRANAHVETLSVPDDIALAVILSLPLLIALGSRTALHEFEAGLADVSPYRRRVTVVRWADLSAVTKDIGQDQDGDWHFYGYLLHDCAGNEIAIGKRRRALRARAEQILAARPSRPAG